MARPFKCRKVNFVPNVTYFKPRGIPISMLEEVVLTIDELEALRLADFEAYSQEDAAEKMKVSRATFGRIIENARKKLVDALISGKAILIEGGNFELGKFVQFYCPICNIQWKVSKSEVMNKQCPGCGQISNLKNKTLGDITMNKRKFQCSDCEHIWEVAYGTARPSECPKCKSSNIHRADDERGKGGRCIRKRCRGS